MFIYAWRPIHGCAPRLPPGEEKMLANKIQEIVTEALGLLGVFFATLIISGHSCAEKVTCGSKVQEVSQQKD